MVRTAVVYSFPAFLIAISWLRLEDPQAAGLDWLVGPRARARTGAGADARAPARPHRAGGAHGLWVAFDTPAPDDKRGFFVPVAERLADGMNGFFNVAMPFSGLERMKMHGVVVLAIFGFCLVLAHAVAARRPLVAVLAVVAGAGWAATLYPSRNVAFGAVILAGALWALAGLRSTPARHGAPRRGGRHSRGGGRVDLVCGREGRHPRVGALESGWLVRRGDLRQLRLGCAVRRHRVLEEEDGLSCGSRGRSAGSTGGRRRSIGSTPTAGSRTRFRSRPASPREPARRPAPAARSLDRAHLGQPGRRDRRAPDQHVVGAAQPVASGRAQLGDVFHFSGGVVRVDRRPRARAAIHDLELRATPRARRTRRSPAALPAGARTASSSSGGRASSRSGRPAGTRGSRRSSTTSATSRSGPTRGSGTEAQAARARARGRRTERPRRSRRGCAAPAASPTTSRRRPPAGCRPLRTSSPRARAATASTSPARWR